MFEINGTFNGEGMVGENHYIYPIPPNYISKSKLVEGDKLRLRITDATGEFIYKQIEPVPRKTLVGIYTGQSTVRVGQKYYRIIQASLSYYRIQSGERAIIEVPYETKSTWAALVGVIRPVDDVS